ncbi:hypothetical protein LMG8520_0108 [Lactococcus lactis subsp. lactis]|uniref:IrrE N-terminal-like domain-containing protein n=2 Tax=Lactococcus lactis TaxID=1358 RepID=A0A2A5S808_LACLH|nr:hypothetical protein [Lactococcus lactis]KAA8701427.1 hypothetical protein F4V48_08730 [Lactococcus lactis subsp. hordniae]KSU14934.1 hypothetical protein LMG8520_0108 [Lactococcus lactis subsp. lactis]MCT3135537.1 hypothetical protein [Lactococcus lactis]PCS09603.1 hypothetical protein RU90_GL001907 [Lactococcus lactis subsp. hordniae]
MDWKGLANEEGIEIIWADKNYSEEGSYIPKCLLYPNGAIILWILLEEYRIEFVALHEIGHLVTGKSLAKVHALLKHLEHCKNESCANRYLLREVAPKFVDANDYNPQYATAHRLCEYLEIKNSVENIQIAQEEIDLALWGEYE